MVCLLPYFFPFLSKVLEMKLVIVCCLLLIAFDLSKGDSPMGCQKEDGTMIPEGESFSDGDCKECFCMDGTIYCVPVQCGWPKCPDGAKPVTLEGNCCPSCPV
ncbi:Protein kinase C-binding protein nell2 [Bulinus truncatus]|nr:Protein kinase C-binding protein nell2 [Bulinus truncatus]